MPRKESKAEQVSRMLAHGIFSDEEIAASVRCARAYVRAVRSRNNAATDEDKQRRMGAYKFRTAAQRRMLNKATCARKAANRRGASKDVAGEIARAVYAEEKKRLELSDA